MKMGYRRAFAKSLDELGVSNFEDRTERIYSIMDAWIEDALMIRMSPDNFVEQFENTLNAVVDTVVS
jgi:hypothetical protein